MERAHGIWEVISLSLARDSWSLLFGHAHDLTIIKTFLFKPFIKCILPLMLSEEGCMFQKCHHIKYSIGSSYLVLHVGFLTRVHPTPLSGVMNGPLKFLTARKILPLLDLLAKFKRVLACSCSQNFCSCSQARFLVSIARNFVNPSLG